MLHPRIGGVWLSSIGTWTDLTFSHIWPRGSEEASFRMERRAFDPAISKGGGLFELYDGGQRIFRGRMAEPGGDGTFVANGSWTEAEGVLAIDGSGNSTNIPNTAIDAAISRGAVTWTRPASLSAVAWGAASTTASEPIGLIELLDKSMAGLGLRWYVDPDGAVRSAADPTVPTYSVPQVVAGQGPTLAEDAYYSHLIGRYFTASATYATVTVGDANAATRWGRQEAFVDLTPMGVISGGTATTQVTNRLALSGARLGFADNLQFGYGEITNTGGVPVELTQPRAGQLVRLQGVTDRTRVAGAPVLDIVIARSVYTDGASTVQLVPQGKAPRDLNEILSVDWQVVI